MLSSWRSLYNKLVLFVPILLKRTGSNPDESKWPSLSAGHTKRVLLSELMRINLTASGNLNIIPNAKLS